MPACAGPAAAAPRPRLQLLLQRPEWPHKLAMTCYMPHMVPSAIQKRCNGRDWPWQARWPRHTGGAACTPQSRQANMRQLTCAQWSPPPHSPGTSLTSGPSQLWWGQLCAGGAAHGPAHQATMHLNAQIPWLASGARTTYIDNSAALAGHAHTSSPTAAAAAGTVRATARAQCAPNGCCRHHPPTPAHPPACLGSPQEVPA
jgi:hypothetical protein